MRFIYQLKDPVTNTVVYIGQSGNIEKRLSRHCYEEKYSEPKKNKWILELKSKGLLPIIEMIDACEDDKAIERENYHILKAIKSGIKLFNRNNNKTWKQYDLSGSFIAEYATGAIVYKMTGFKPNKRDKKLHEFTWYYDDLGTEKRQPYRKLSGVIKIVEQYDLSGIKINEFIGVREAERKTGIHRCSIKRVAINGRMSAGGFVWKYKEVRHVA